MTRRDAALLSLTLAGLYCLFVATMYLWPVLAMIAEPRRSVMETSRVAQRIAFALPLLILTCAGVTLIQSRRRLSTRVFGENPAHDSVAAVDAGDMRLLAVRIVGLLLCVQTIGAAAQLAQTAGAPRSQVPLFMNGSTILWILFTATAALLTFLAPRKVVAFLFAAGVGNGTSARYRDAMQFSLGIIGAYYVVHFLPAAVRAVTEAVWRRDAMSASPFSMLIVTGLPIAACIAGAVMFAGRGALANLWSRLHPMGSDVEPQP